MIKGLVGILLALCWHSVSAERVDFEVNKIPPCWSEEMKYQGMCGELLQALSAEAGIEARIHFKPLKRLIEDEHNNDIGNPDLYMYQQDFTSIIPILSYRSAFYAYQPVQSKKKSLQLSRFEDLARYKVGILKGTLIDEGYFTHLGIYFERSYKQTSIFKKLKVGRIDLALEIDFAAEYVINQLYPELVDNFIKIEVPNSKAVIAIMLSEELPNAKAIGEKYRKALETMISNGQYQGILRHYNRGSKLDSGKLLSELQYFNRLYNFSAVD